MVARDYTHLSLSHTHTHTHTNTQEAGAQEEGDMKQQEVAGHMRLEREVEEDMLQRLEEGARPAYVIQS